MQKKLFRVLLVLLLFFAIIGSAGIFTKAIQPKLLSCFLTSETYTVVMDENGFKPSIFSVKRCTKVVFENNGIALHWPASDLHPTHGIYSEFDPKTGILSNKSWSFVFDRVGTWKFHDHLSPLMYGVITVTP